MRLLRSVSLVSSCLLFSVSAAAPNGTAAPDNDVNVADFRPTSEQYKMGFEVESSVVKIRPGKGNQTYMMDVFRSLHTPWAFTSDTLDNSLKSSQASWMNTECKTIGGLSYEQITKALSEMKITWEILLTLCDDHTNDCTLQEDNINFPIIWVNEGQRTASIWTPFSTPQQQTRLAYPQISYSLPLEFLPCIFQRLTKLTLSNSAENTTSDLVRFTNGLSSPLNDDFSQWDEKKLLQMKNTPGKSAAAMSRFNTEINRRMQSKLLLVLNKNIEISKPTAASGLAYLFFFYAYQLFCENIYIREDEPGPKPMVAVMSRVPFSAMYRRLIEKEKNKFRAIVEVLLIDFSGNKLRKYKTARTDSNNVYIDLLENERITLGDWYHSIIAPSEGREDLLSPPPGCEGCRPSYGMGAYDGKDIPNAFALVEARGYSRLKPDGLPITIDNVTLLIQNENEWFFSLATQARTPLGDEL